MGEKTTRQERHPRPEPEPLPADSSPVETAAELPVDRVGLLEPTGSASRSGRRVGPTGRQSNRRLPAASSPDSAFGVRAATGPIGSQLVTQLERVVSC